MSKESEKNGDHRVNVYDVDKFTYYNNGEYQYNPQTQSYIASVSPNEKYLVTYHYNVNEKVSSIFCWNIENKNEDKEKIKLEPEFSVKVSYIPHYRPLICVSDDKKFVCVGKGLGK